MSKWDTLTLHEKAALLRHVDAKKLQELLSLSEEQLDAITPAASSLADAGESTDAAKAYDDFLKTEYNNVAAAHFHTNTNITRFFQFYLVIVGLPLTIAGIVFRFVQGTSQIDPEQQSLSGILESDHGVLLFAASLAIALIGLCMLAYIVSLHLDSLLYARVVNGIRHHFISRGSIDIDHELATRVLPRSTSFPRYLQWHFFGWVVFAFAILNSLYFLAAGVILGERLFEDPSNYYLPLALLWVLWLICHLLVYEELARYREHYYLRRYAIGIDVDGVLNKHREMFCRVLLRESGKDVDPTSITHIPVHECTTLKDSQGERIDVSQQEEQLVFNRVEYWEEMPPADDAERTLREFSESLHYQIEIFTYRPWPNPIEYRRAVEQASLTDTEQRTKLYEFRSNWQHKARMSQLEPIEHADTILKRAYNRFLEWRRHKAKKTVTREWFKKHKLKLNTLTIERGGVHVVDERAKFRNRFTMARRNEIRLFIEDDVRKARKMSHVCEFVYLIAHPYNDVDDLPRNVIRLASLTEIKQHIRDHL